MKINYGLKCTYDLRIEQMQFITMIHFFFKFYKMFANFYAKKKIDQTIFDANNIISCIRIVHFAILKLHAANHPSHRPISPVFLAPRNVNCRGIDQRKISNMEEK